VHTPQAVSSARTEETKIIKSIQFHSLHFQTGFGIRCCHLIPTTIFMGIQTVELEMEAIFFPS
jgi:hypothetical protein